MAITIANRTDVTITTYSAEFNGVPHLAVFRQAPFRFTLVSPNAVYSRFVVYINDDYSNQGSIDLINHIKTLALESNEQWSNTQLFEASQAQTIYIIHDGFDSIMLKQSTEQLSRNEIESLNPGTTVFLSYDCTAAGLEVLVNQLLAWMATQTVV